MKQYSYFGREDNTKEVISKTYAISRLQAANRFALIKRLTLKQFLKIFKVSK